MLITRQFMLSKANKPWRVPGMICENYIVQLYGKKRDSWTAWCIISLSRIRAMRLGDLIKISHCVNIILARGVMPSTALEDSHCVRNVQRLVLNGIHSVKLAGLIPGAELMKVPRHLRHHHQLSTTVHNNRQCSSSNSLQSIQSSNR